MANSQLLALACLAVLAASALVAPAAGCTITSQNQTGSLTGQVPRGCLSTPRVEEALAGIIEPDCFNSVRMNVTNSTGSDCENPGTFFNVSFTDSDCFEGVDVGGGQMRATPGGGSNVTGEFIIGQNFTGTVTPAGLFTVTVEGFNCQLVYNTTNVGAPNVTTTGDDADAPAARGGSAAAAATPGAGAGTTTPTTTNTMSSGGAAAAPAALMGLLAGALALVF